VGRALAHRETIEQSTRRRKNWNGEKFSLWDVKQVQQEGEGGVSSRKGPEGKESFPLLLVGEKKEESEFTEETEASGKERSVK